MTAGSLMRVVALVSLCLAAPAAAQHRPPEREPREPEPPVDVCAEYGEDFRDDLRGEYDRYLDLSRDNARAFREKAAQARSTGDRPFLERAYRTAKRFERRESDAALVHLRERYDLFLDLAEEAVCDLGAFKADYEEYRGLVRGSHKTLMRRLARTYRRYAKTFGQPEP
jgi:hypothetical protein